MKISHKEAERLRGQIKALRREVKKLSVVASKRAQKKMKKAARVSQEDTLNMLRAELKSLSVWERIKIAIGLILGNV